jgi:diaminobutyrate-2-oxoglutarate transaminase
LGLPLAVVLVHPTVDTQPPGAHSGTFRGNNLAFVAGTAALELWRDPAFAARVQARAEQIDRRLAGIAAASGARVRGRGLLRGLAWSDPSIAGRVSERAFALGVLAEPCGPRGEVLKLLPPLTVPEEVLDTALDTVQLAAEDVIGRTI